MVYLHYITLHYITLHYVVVLLAVSLLYLAVVTWFIYIALHYITLHYVVVLLAVSLLYLAVVTDAQCGGSCSACVSRYGCMTAAWGRCCTQFFMHNGKRSDKGSMQGFVEYIKLKSRFIEVCVLKQYPFEGPQQILLLNHLTLRPASPVCPYLTFDLKYTGQ